MEAEFVATVEELGMMLSGVGSLLDGSFEEGLFGGFCGDRLLPGGDCCDSVPLAVGGCFPGGSF